MDSGARIEIVGAGVWGLSAALALLEKGASRVRVWERDQAGSGATSRAAGLVSTHLREPDDIALVLETRRGIERLREWGRTEALPAAGHVYNPCGNLTLASPAQEASLRAMRDRVHRAGAEARMIEEWSDAPWPLDHLDGLRGLYSPADGHVEAGDLVELLRSRIRALGGAVRALAPVRLLAEGPTCAGVEALDARVAADVVVLAAGAWSKPLLATTGRHLPVKAYRTQLAQVRHPSQGLPILHDAAQHVYARPDGAGALLVGDGTEHHESHPETYNAAADAGFLEKVASAASHRFPGGENARLGRSWSGLCVATPDRHPLVGPCPGLDGLVLMVGDNGFGLMRSLALGQRVARGILGGSWEARHRPSRLAFGADFPIREGFEL